MKIRRGDFLLCSNAHRCYQANTDIGPGDPLLASSLREIPPMPKPADHERVQRLCATCGEPWLAGAGVAIEPVLLERDGQLIPAAAVTLEPI